ncbi:hypothetical protein ACA910_002004 [Epithemia clementina (nom. ined.)]
MRAYWMLAKQEDDVAEAYQKKLETRSGNDEDKISSSDDDDDDDDDDENNKCRTFAKPAPRQPRPSRLLVGGGGVCPHSYYAAGAAAATMRDDHAEVVMTHGTVTDASTAQKYRMLPTRQQWSQNACAAAGSSSVTTNRQVAATWRTAAQSPALSATMKKQQKDSSPVAVDLSFITPQTREKLTSLLVRHKEVIERREKEQEEVVRQQLAAVTRRQIAKNQKILATSRKSFIVYQSGNPRKSLDSVLAGMADSSDCEDSTCPCPQNTQYTFNIAEGRAPPGGDRNEGEEHPVAGVDAMNDNCDEQNENENENGPVVRDHQRTGGNHVIVSLPSRHNKRAAMLVPPQQQPPHQSLSEENEYDDDEDEEQLLKLFNGKKLIYLSPNVLSNIMQSVQFEHPQRRKRKKRKQTNEPAASPETATATRKKTKKMKSKARNLTPLLTGQEPTTNELRWTSRYVSPRAEQQEGAEWPDRGQEEDEDCGPEKDDDENHRCGTKIAEMNPTRFRGNFAKVQSNIVGHQQQEKTEKRLRQIENRTMCTTSKKNASLPSRSVAHTAINNNDHTPGKAGKDDEAELLYTKKLAGEERAGLPYGFHDRSFLHRKKGFFMKKTHSAQNHHLYTMQKQNVPPIGNPVSAALVSSPPVQTTTEPVRTLVQTNPDEDMQTKELEERLETQQNAGCLLEEVVVVEKKSNKGSTFLQQGSSSAAFELPESPRNGNEEYAAFEQLQPSPRHNGDDEKMVQKDDPTDEYSPGWAGMGERALENEPGGDSTKLDGLSPLQALFANEENLYPESAEKKLQKPVDAGKMNHTCLDATVKQKKSKKANALCSEKTTCLGATTTPQFTTTYCKTRNIRKNDKCSLVSMKSTDWHVGRPSSGDASCRLNFPGKVYSMLEEVELQERTDVISFVDNGRAFQIHNQDVFEKHVMPLFFASCRMPSFQRQLHMYGFRRINHEPFVGAYTHPDFIKSRKDLLTGIQRRTPVSEKVKGLRKQEKHRQGQGHGGIEHHHHQRQQQQKDPRATEDKNNEEDAEEETGEVLATGDKGEDQEDDDKEAAEEEMGGVVARTDEGKDQEDEEEAVEADEAGKAVAATVDETTYQDDEEEAEDDEETNEDVATADDDRVDDKDQYNDKHCHISFYRQHQLIVALPKMAANFDDGVAGEEGPTLVF